MSRFFISFTWLCLVLASVQVILASNRAATENMTSPAFILQDSTTAYQIANMQPAVSAVQSTKDSLASAGPEAFVVFENDTLYSINYNLGPFSAEERASALSERLVKILESGPVDLQKLEKTCTDVFCNLKYNGKTLTTITKYEAEAMGVTLDELSDDHFQILSTFFEKQEDRSWMAILHRAGIFLAALILFIIGFKYLNRGLKWIMNRVFNKIKHQAGSISFNNYEFLSEDRTQGLMLFGLRMIKNIILIVLIYLYSLILFSIFPKTKPIALKLLEYVINPVKRFSLALLGYIPELITILLIALAGRYLARMLKFFAREIETERLVIPGFYSDWAQPTYRLLKILVYLFTFVVIFPYLPGSDSPAFQGVSVFLGLLLSLGSTSAISNIIAGLVIIYMRAFRLGDRVRIGDTFGDVIEKTILVTKIRTSKNEEVTIPNAAILNGSTINYTSGARDGGLILYSSVTIGYDVPWRQVHQLLIEAAMNTRYIEADPKPFVLQTSLDDFYISYQINAFTREASKQARIYSDLHQNIQDSFNTANVEIMSPHYRAERDGNATTVPVDWKPRDDAREDQGTHDS